MRELIKNIAHLLKTTAIVSGMAITLFFADCKTPDNEITDAISPEITV